MVKLSNVKDSSKKNKVGNINKIKTRKMRIKIM